MPIPVLAEPVSGVNAAVLDVEGDGEEQVSIALKEDVRHGLSCR
jgi:hypothetical protein